MPKISAPSTSVHSANWAAACWKPPPVSAFRGKCSAERLCGLQAAIFPFKYSGRVAKRVFSIRTKGMKSSISFFPEAVNSKWTGIFSPSAKAAWCAWRPPDAVPYATTAQFRLSCFACNIEAALLLRKTPRTPIFSANPCIGDSFFLPCGAGDLTPIICVQPRPGRECRDPMPPRRV